MSEMDEARGRLNRRLLETKLLGTQDIGFDEVLEIIEGVSDMSLDTELLEWTRTQQYHPDGWEWPCACGECVSLEGDVWPTPRDRAGTLADSLHESQLVERVMKCSDCCCCISFAESRTTGDEAVSITMPRVVSRCADDLDLVLANIDERHPDCPRVGKCTVWPEVDV